MRRKRKLGSLSVIALIIGLMSSGCGGDDDAGAEDSVARVNAACSSSNKAAGTKIKRTMNAAEAKGPLTEKDEIRLEVGSYVPTLVVAAKSQLAAVEASDGDDEGFEELRDAYQAWIKKAEGAPFKVVITNDVYNEARKLGGELGLDSCNSNPFEFVYGGEFIN